MNCLLVYHEAQDSYYLLNPNASYLNRDGTAKMLGAIDMDSHKITNLANGSANGDAVNYLQLGGDAAREFLAATATTGNAVVNKTQFDAKTGISTDTVAGIVEKATQAEMNAGTADKFPSAAEIFNGFSFSSGNKEFTVPTFMGSLAIKMGTVTTGNLSAGNNAQTVTFTTAFPTACLMAYAITKTSDASDIPNFWTSVYSFSKTNMVVWLFEAGASDQGAGAGFNWLAIGY